MSTPARPSGPWPLEMTPAKRDDDLLRMAAWNAVFGVVSDAPALEGRMRALVAGGARFHRSAR